MGKCYFKREWLKDDRFAEWLGEVPNNPGVFFCRVCRQQSLIGTNGIKALTSHMKSSKHSTALQASKDSKAIFSFMKSKPATVESPTTVTVTVPSSTRTLDPHISDEKTLMAEVRWVLHLVTSHCSSRSSDNIGDLFRGMFTDSKIAQQFQCGRTKAGYLATFGLAPAILDELNQTVKDLDFYTLLFDESFNSELESKQMDVHIRFVSKNDLVETKYYTSFFMGHAKAVDIEKNIKEAMSKLGNQKLLQISMDGPNVNLKVFKDLNSEFESNQLCQLVNIGTCGLHVLHNAFKDGMKASGWELGSLLKSVFYLFQESPARREDFFKITESTNLPLQFCGHRWLENKDTAERLLSILPAIKTYVNACKDCRVSEPLCKSFKTTCDFIFEKLLTVRLHCFIYICKILQPFLEKYQSNSPLTPYLATDLFEIIKRLYSLILKDEYLMTLKMNSDLNPAKIDKEHFRSHNRIELGCQADQELSKLVKTKTISERDILGVHLDFKKMCMQIITKIVAKSPIAYKFAKDATCLNPDNFSCTESISKFHDLVKYLHGCRWLSSDEVDNSIYQFKALRENHQGVNHVGRLDEVYKRMDLTSVPALRKVINIVLTLSHGNAEVERGFSVNKEVSVENMAERSIIAKRLICQYIKDHGYPATVPLNKAVLSSCSGAYRRYKAALEEKKNLKEMDEKSRQKKRKAEELREMNSKKRKMELSIDLLVRKADDLAEEAETSNSSKAHELLVQSNALRKDAKAKKVGLNELNACIQTLECGHKA